MPQLSCRSHLSAFLHGKGKSRQAKPFGSEYFVCLVAIVVYPNQLSSARPDRMKYATVGLTVSVEYTYFHDGLHVRGTVLLIVTLLLFTGRFDDCLQARPDCEGVFQAACHGHFRWFFQKECEHCGSNA